MWGDYSASITRTTNACESFHSKLNSMFYAAHPSIFILLDVLLVRNWKSGKLTVTWPSRFWRRSNVNNADSRYPYSSFKIEMVTWPSAYLTFSSLLLEIQCNTYAEMFDVGTRHRPKRRRQALQKEAELGVLMMRRERPHTRLEFLKRVSFKCLPPP